MQSPISGEALITQYVSWKSTRIGNPELRTMVSRLVVNEVIQWLSGHPSVEAQLRRMQTFRFPEVWYGKL